VSVGLVGRAKHIKVVPSVALSAFGHQLLRKFSESLDANMLGHPN
jgi:hypothetical protein